MNNKAASKDGYLKKRGGIHKVCHCQQCYKSSLVQNWRIRWFVLKEGKLSYYKDHQVGYM